MVLPLKRKLLLGKVISVTKMGYAVTRITDPNLRVRLGSRVIDDKGKEIGKLIDIIGNVNRPYAVIRIQEGIPTIGTAVYMIVQKPRRRGGRRKTRRGARRSVRGRGRMQTRERDRNP